VPFLAAIGIVAKMAICAVIAFIGGYWIMSNWFERRFTGWQAGVLGAGLLAVMCISVPMAMYGGPGILLLLAVVFGVAGALRLLGHSAERHIGRSLQDADVAKYQDAIIQYPDNPHAHSLLAEAYRRTGRTELALQEYETALQIDPSLKQERYWVRRLREEGERRASGRLHCPRCGTARPKSGMVCPQCGREYSRLEVWVHAFQKMPPREKAVWVGVVGGAAVAMVAMIALAPGLTKIAALTAVVLAPPAVILLRARARRAGESEQCGSREE
jgi:hypothetical protein